MIRQNFGAIVSLFIACLAAAVLLRAEGGPLSGTFTKWSIIRPSHIDRLS